MNTISKSISILALCSIAFSISAQEKTDLQKELLHGPVKSYTEMEFLNFNYLREGEFEKPDLLWDSGTELLFNQNGLMIRETRLDEQGDAIQETIHLYDNRDLLIETKILSEDGTLISRTNYEYDDQNRIILKKVYYDDSDESNSTTFFRYDENGRNDLAEKYDANNRPTFTYTKKYDEAGNLVMETRRDKHDPVLNLDKVMRYDAAGNRTDLSYYYPNDSLPNDQYLWKYDQSLNIMEESNYEYGALISRTAYTYDQNNMLSNIQYYNSDDELAGEKRITYKLDTHGNWLSKTISDGNDTASYSTRSYTYYPE